MRRPTTHTHPTCNAEHHGYYSSGSLTTVTSDDKRIISCYSDSATSQAECFRTGRGWNGREAAASFEITDGETNDTRPVNVRFYWSDRSTNCTVDPSPGRDRCNYETLLDHCVGDLDEDCTNSFVVEVSRPKSTSPEQVIFMEFFPGLPPGKSGQVKSSHKGPSA